MLDVSKLTTEQLISYDQMMFEVTLKVKHISGLAVAIYSEVLEELGKRGQITIISGSYAEPGNLLANRKYSLQP